MLQQTILVVEDDPRILRFVQSCLKLAGYDVVVTASGEGGLESARAREPDLMILDIGLPGMDGWEVLEELRTFSNIPVIILSARDQDIDKVKGLRLGADDYLAKPFNPEELTARIEAVMRRVRGDTGLALDIYQYGDVTIDLRKHVICAADRQAGITRLEGLLLGYLINNSDKVLTYEEILTKVWGAEYRDDIQLLRTAVTRIRGKFGEAAGAKELIKNVPRVGYLFDASSG